MPEITRFYGIVIKIFFLKPLDFTATQGYLKAKNLKIFGEIVFFYTF